MSEHAALIRFAVLDGHATAAPVVRNRSRGRRIRFVGGCDFITLARTIRTSGRSAWRGAVIPRESGLLSTDRALVSLPQGARLNFPTACSLQGHTQSGLFTTARFISEFTQPLLEQRS